MQLDVYCAHTNGDDYLRLMIFDFCFFNKKKINSGVIGSPYLICKSDMEDDMQCNPLPGSIWV